MSFPKAFSDLRRAVEIIDIIQVRELLKNNSELLNHIDFKAAKSWILTEVASCRNPEINEFVINFIKIGPKDSLKDHLETAIQKGNSQFTEFLLKNGVRIAPSKCKDNSLARRIFNRGNLATRKDMLVVLLKYGMLDPRARNQRKETLLLQFIDERDQNVEKDDSDAVEIAKILLDAGVRINKCDKKGQSALLRSISTRNVPLITYLVERRADVNRTDDDRRSPLLMAIFWNLDIKLIDLLLSEGSDVNFRNRIGWSTPLHAACIGNYEEAISLLLSYGADISATNIQDETPLFQSLKTTYLNRDRSALTLIKEFAILKFENMFISPRDMNLLQENSKAREYFEKCTAELRLMANTEFCGSLSIYSILKRSIDEKKLSLLTKNEQLAFKFEENLKKCTYYESNLRKIWEEAFQVRGKSEVVESRLYSIFGKHFPNIVILKLAKNFTVEDLPLE